VHDATTRRFQQQCLKGIPWPQSPPMAATLAMSSSIVFTTTTTQISPKQCNAKVASTA